MFNAIVVGVFSGAMGQVIRPPNIGRTADTREAKVAITSMPSHTPSNPPSSWNGLWPADIVPHCPHPSPPPQMPGSNIS